MAKAALPYLNDKSAVLTLTYLGAIRTVPNYNTMGLAKASLEASVRYLAESLGSQNRGLRANGISAGPIKTLAASGLVGLQWLGDAVVAWWGWPVPGALVGLLLLLGALFAACGVPQALDDVSTPLLRHLMLLLIPSVAAVGLYAGLLSQHAAAFLLVAVVVTALTLVVTAWTLQRLIRRSSR